ncbi:transglutaminase-like domain-containing protein [Anaerotruncus rubiinfantis]|uniref:transglutaminase-like domain-containing protein n=1 Tax=Anaerotruncus rubiinfantis TaxID=1720200 RepID=UPI001FA97252|nr:transglutaminase-like domain-containing protein [Anaerotruncus rubiinfantis]
MNMFRSKQMILALLALMLAVLTAGCSSVSQNNLSSQPQVPQASRPVQDGLNPSEQENQLLPQGGGLTEILDGEVPIAARPVQTTIRVPDASGVTTYSGGGVTIDASNTSEGYVMVKCSAGGKIKLQITGSNKTTYTYDLGKGGYEVFPLTSGSGSYSIKVFKNVSGNQYAQLYSKSIKVELSSSLLPYLYPNQYVNFSADSTTVQKGAELAAGAADDLGVVQAVYNYVISSITYDYNKASSVKSGYLPKVDSILASGKGICFDYAAVMATMLRTQNIPTRLEVGYVSGGTYHAWVSVYLKEIGWVNGIIYFDGTSWKLMDPTFASNGNSSDSIMQFIGNGSNYSTKYVY